MIIVVFVLLLFFIIMGLFFFMYQSKIVSFDSHSLEPIPTDPRITKWIRDNRPTKPVKIYLDYNIISILPKGRFYHCISNAHEANFWASCPFMSFIVRGSSIVFASEQLWKALGVRVGTTLDMVINQLIKLSNKKTWHFWESKIYSNKYEHLQLNSFSQLHIYKKDKLRYFIFTREASNLSLIREKQEDIIKKLLSISQQKIHLMDDAFKGKNYAEGNLNSPIMVPTLGGRIYYESRDNIFCQVIRKYKKELIRLMIFYIKQLANENADLFTTRIYYLNRKINHIIQNLQRKSCRGFLESSRKINFDLQGTIISYLKKSPNSSYHDCKVSWKNNWKDNMILGDSGLMDNLCAGIAFLIGEYPMHKIDVVLDYKDKNRCICLFGLPNSIDKTFVQCLTSYKSIDYKILDNSLAVHFLL